MLPLSLSTTLLAVSSLALADLPPHYTLQIQPTAPDASMEVPADFFSFGFETAFFNHFENDFSENLVHSINSRMSKPLVLRIGGTSGDLVQFRESQSEAAVCQGAKGCPFSSENTFVLGPSYFNAFKRFEGTHMTFQAPINPKKESEDWIRESMDYVRHAAETLGHDRITGIALGNEPDYYAYGLEKYISRALLLEKKIIDDLGLKNESRRIFELGDIPNSVIKRDVGTWGITNLLRDNLNKNGLGKYAAQHYYQIEHPGEGTDDNIQALLMNHTAISRRFPGIEENIKYIHNSDDKIDFVISETGSVIGEEPVRFAAGFGAALWAVDFHLKAMSHGVKRVSNTFRPVATHSFWIPDNSASKTTSDAAVHAIFISAPYVADFVGEGGSLGRVIEIEVPGQPDLFSAYAMYDLQTGRIQRIALVNLKEWYPKMGTPRGQVEITLDTGDMTLTQSGTVKRMQAENGSRGMGLDLGGLDDNVTWAGEQWTHNIDLGRGHFPHGRQQDTLQFFGGKAVVSIPDSEAVMVSFD
ncbi:hypothetical protein N7532_011683 [Penicillium argentinense]|uniref:Beta-glucuronidase C-terminal domain-containing protein n=1 Tax=Penicillium argentinense TaxID=1131581 RepID=A0A9W9EJ27_9EURO|nr:uncharacterized protein N7532_011683 [Penicillium argentinense]KAJ5082640.1 hypothetical protein N7532_011683 [Penicillium argentinense]